MASTDTPFVLRDFLGLNLRDGGERANEREFIKIQNLYRKEKGQLYKRPGSTDDLLAADVPGANRVTGLHRHPSAPCSQATFYHCTPTSTPITHPGAAGLVLSQVVSASGRIFAAAPVASNTLRFCHSYIGMGVESVWDTRTRFGFVPFAGVPINSWDQPGLQSLTLASTTNIVQVTHPGAFPAGVRAVNVFMAIGNPGDAAGDRRNLNYVGTLHSTTDVLTIDYSIANQSTYNNPIVDADVGVEGRYDAAGNIPPGQYFVSMAWLSDNDLPYDELADFAGQKNILTNGKVVSVGPDQNSIALTYGTASGLSTGGASHLYVFLGTKSAIDGPMVFVGVISPQVGLPVIAPGFAARILIRDIPVNMNAQSHAGDPTGLFNASPFMRAAISGIRHGFVVKKDPDRSVAISEVFHSRSALSLFGDLSGSIGENYLLIRTNLDRLLDNSPAQIPNTISDPFFTYYLGASYFVNGYKYILQSDGMTLARMVAKASCVIPEYLRTINTFKNQLVGASAYNENVIFGSNAIQPNNWSDGGTGTALRFAIVGDSFEGKLYATSIFSYTSGTESPKAFIVAFKKNSCYSLSNIPDAVSGINAQGDQLSGRVGCIAARTIVQTKNGMLFLGSDGDIYIVRGSGEPFPVGGRVKPLLQHLSRNETLMKMATACQHGNFYKLSYPSSSASTFNDAQLWADLRVEDGVPAQWDGPHIGINIASQIAKTGDGDTDIRIGSLADGLGVALLDDESTYLDRGSPIVSVLKSKVYRWKSEMHLKRIIRMFMETYYSTIYAQDILFEMFADQEYTQNNKHLNDADPLFGEAAWRKVVALVGDDNLIGSNFQFQITHSNDADFVIAAIGVTYKPERREIV